MSQSQSTLALIILGILLLWVATTGKPGVLIASLFKPSSVVVKS